MKEFNLEQNNKRKVNNTFNFDKIIDSLKYIKIDEENKIKIEGKIETINEIKNDIVFLEKRIENLENDINMLKNLLINNKLIDKNKHNCNISYIS